MFNLALEDGDSKEKNISRFQRVLWRFSVTPIIVVDEVGMKLDPLVELYVFLSSDSTFDLCL
jgi:hypothetical protein